MKQLLTIFLVLHLASPSLAQTTEPSDNRSATDYLLKSNKQKTAGWILLGGGAGLTGIGLVVGASTVWNDIVEGNNNGSTAAGIMMVTGLASMAGSIPLFIAAGKNRKRAAGAVSFIMENSTIIDQWAISARQYPAIAIRLSL
ncbi:MAG: hypothetical protein ACXWV6_09970 [Chitinophagaceae bacterium]